MGTEIPAPFQRLLIDHLAGCSPPAAARWLRSHGLLSVARDEELAPAVRRLLAPDLERTEARNRFAIWRFQDIVDALEPLSVCALKGVHVLDALYAGDLAVRPMVDLDLLVRDDDVADVVNRLGRLGFGASSASELDASPHHVVLFDGDLKVELHHRLAFKHGASSRWAELVPVPARLHDRDVHVLDRETLLVHLATHFVRHVPFTHLKWTLDLLLALDLDHDPERLAERAERLGARRTVAAVWRILERGLGITALPDTRRGWRDRAAIALNERLVWSRLVREPLRAADSRSRWARNTSALLLADRAADRAQYLVTKLKELARRT